jgi:probable phosphoglycerate mutase
MDGSGASVAVPASPRLLLLRHGESTWNLERLVQGQDDRGVLTDRGRDQVRRSVESMGEAVAAIVTSDLARARESAQIAAQILGLEPRVDPDLRERCFGVLEGSSIEDVPGRLVGVVDGVVVDADTSPDGGETLREFRARSLRALARAARDGVSTLVVTHGGVIRVLKTALAVEPLVGTAWREVDNASLWAVDVAEARGSVGLGEVERPVVD